MNCTGVLQFPNLRHWGPSPIMPVDMAMRICLASSPPLHSFLTNNCSSTSSSAGLLQHSEPLRPCLSPGCNIAVATTTSTTPMNTTLTAAEVGSILLCPRMKKKKSVVFADSQGLALTAVYVFNEFEDDLLSELQLQLSEIEGATTGPHLRDGKESSDYGSVLVLDFTPPASDYLELRNRLKAQHVCLETCSVQERLLWGTIQVQNICFEKSVSVRITFDSWRSFSDVKCQYLNNIYSGRDTDTFSFSVMVPELLDPSDRVEFCIQYQTPDNSFWDNNRGNNYQLLVVDPSGGLNRSTDSPAHLEIQRDCGGETKQEMEFDPFGSPRTSAGIFPEWQSWSCIETSTPYW